MLYIYDGGCQGIPRALGYYIGSPGVTVCGLVAFGTTVFVGWNGLKFDGMNGLALAFISVFFSSTG